ncbi:CLUMA_CG004724, isoform A [Clunio marinus]|uniref:CLUMA_CG004724, isoform A n=1 Tax=Clunio marinus TaxID=568069 RepID=A0A1J1HUJ3_9DIPT|nr:CLUMA_CG004724, isoform A [Clunio marinus]
MFSKFLIEIGFASLDRDSYNKLKSITSKCDYDEFKQEFELYALEKIGEDVWFKYYGIMDSSSKEGKPSVIIRKQYNCDIEEIYNIIKYAISYDPVVAYFKALCENLSGMALSEIERYNKEVSN